MIRLLLYVRAGGRCEFDGCNTYLLEHHLTNADGNFAEMAHIWAFSPMGPRGMDESRSDQVHALDNLMLLCPVCHKLIDDRPDEYTVAMLREHKKAHEDRVFQLTDTKPDRHTVALVCRGKVAGQTVTVSVPEMQAAAAPRYVLKRDVVDIDLTAYLEPNSEEEWSLPARAIDNELASLYSRRYEAGPINHVSVFALAPIPLLMHLGSRLSNKVPTSLFQRHRDTDDWNWKASNDAVAYHSTIVREGTDPKAVAFVVSLSGRISVSDLPAEVDDRFTVYDLSLSAREPESGFLNTEASLRAYRGEFRRLIRQVTARHSGLEMIHLFPAVPAPVAVAMGMDLFPKRDPALRIYDFRKDAGGFVRTMEINNDSK